MTTPPTDVISDLEPGNAVGIRPCVPANEVRAGDTLFAAGFRRGPSRRVLETRIVDGALYVKVAEGWYRWRRVYANVLDF